MAPAQASAEIYTAVTQTIHSLFHHLDNGTFESVAALFAQDGVWVRQGVELAGPDAILAALRQRPADLVTRHLVTNLIVTATGDSVIALYNITVFDHVGPARPAPLALPSSLFSNRDELIHSSDGWRFYSRRPSLVFKRP